MATLGPILSVPVGFAIFTVIFVVVFMILSEVTWHTMKHFPEDEEDWSEGNHFIIDSDEMDAAHSHD